MIIFSRRRKTTRQCEGPRNQRWRRHNPDRRTPETGRIKLEARLEQAFANRAIDRVTLMTLLSEIATVRGDRRFVHLATHLGTPEILTPGQIKTYNRLRGYTTY